MTAPPSPASPSRPPPRSPAGHLRRSAYGLPALGVVLFVLFSLMLPHTFPAPGHGPSRSCRTHRSLAVLALAATIPIVTGA